MPHENPPGLAVDDGSAPNASEWYYIHAGHELGPFSLGELVEKVVVGKIDGDDLVKQGGGLWTRAREVEGLKQEFLIEEAKQKPPEKTETNHGIWASTTKFGPASFLLLGFLAFVAAGIFFAQKWSQSNVPRETEFTVEEQQKCEVWFDDRSAGRGFFTGAVHNGTKKKIHKLNLVLTLKKREPREIGEMTHLLPDFALPDWAEREYTVSVLVEPQTTTPIMIDVADRRISLSRFYIRSIVGE